MLKPSTSKTDPFFFYEPHGEMRRKSPSDKLQIYIPPIKRPVKDWRTECLGLAAHIKKLAKGQSILLFLSGGIDSSAIALSLKEVKADFQPIILKYSGGHNEYDLRFAYEFCDSEKLKPKVIELDPVQKWKFDGERVSEMSQTASPQLILPLIVSEKLEGFVVLGGGDLYFKYGGGGGELWFMEEEEKFYAWPKFFYKKRMPAFVHFFSATVEIIYSQLKDPLTQSLLKAPGDYFDFMKYKSQFYYKHFGLKIREKQTGFENLQKEDAVFRAKFSKNPLNKNQILYYPALSLAEKIKREGVLIQ